MGRRINETVTIYCNGCKDYVFAQRAFGLDIYPHRPDLKGLKFWQCPTCNNYVGSHRKGGEPLGTIPTPELRMWRNRVHRVIDPLWKNGHIDRGRLYTEIKYFLGLDTYFHTANINDVETAQQVIEFAEALEVSITE